MSTAAPRSMPTGTVTFVLADVEGSVRLWETEPDAMALATAKFGSLVAHLVANHGGVRPTEQGEGDSFVAVFTLAHDAVVFTLELQRALHSEAWAADLIFRVRTALHTGTAQLRGDDNYMGPTVNRCARIRGLAHGGQVIVSGATAALVADDLAGDVRVVDLGRHYLRDFDRPEHLFQVSIDGLLDRFPPLRDERHAHRLPTALTSFVARGDEMRSVDELLGRGRVVTLTGSGGSGKTRLALESARGQHERFADGVAWADAAPLADAALLTSCVAAALGVREVPTEPLIDTVVQEVGDRAVLLVVDNCEHVIDEAARVVERLVVECPRITILATSREPLGVPGELSMRVPSLDEDAAVTLFGDRAKGIDAEFVLTPEEEAAARDVCRRLDGIPLAIELAAARISVLSPGQIAAGLADRFRLLTGGSRTALPRQRTLEASVDWSYRLLSDAERTLLERLSVFAGGFTLDAATNVCGDDETEDASLLDDLSALVTKSLVQVEAAVPGQAGRYRMLETIRHFALQRLADTSNSDAVRDRHLAYFLSVAEEAGPRIERAHEVTALDRLDADLDNVRAALDWAQQGGENELLLRFVAALWLFFEVRCRFDEGIAWLRTGLDASPAPTATRARALHGLGDMSLFTLDMETVAAAGEEIVVIAEHLGDPSILARGTTILCWAAAFGTFRDTGWAVDALTTTLPAIDESDDPWLFCDACTALSLAKTMEGDLRAGAEAARQAVAAAERSGMRGPLERALFFRGWVATRAGELEAGEEALQRAVEIADELDETFILSLALVSLAFSKFRRGDPVGAQDDAETAVALATRFGNPFGIGMGSLALALTLAWRGADDEARSCLDDSTEIHEQLAIMWLTTADREAAAALVAARSGGGEAARGRLAALADTWNAKPYALTYVSVYLGWIDRMTGNDAAAESAFTTALEAALAGGARMEAAVALHELGVSAARRGQFERAARLVAAGSTHCPPGITWLRPAGVPDGQAEIDEARAELGADAYAAEWEAGAGMTMDEAARFAMRGKGGRRRLSWGWESLTPAELDVVRLVTEGLTNPAIADKLLISRGTVKVHLGHVFTKLGVASRAELAAEAGRRFAGS